jgi:hypothetical protein
MVGVEDHRPLLDRLADIRPVRADHAETAIISHHRGTETQKSEAKFEGPCFLIVVFL